MCSPALFQVCHTDTTFNSEPPERIGLSSPAYQTGALPLSYRGKSWSGWVIHPLEARRNAWWRRWESNPPRVACKASLCPSTFPIARRPCQRTGHSPSGVSPDDRWNQRESNSHFQLARLAHAHRVVAPMRKNGGARSITHDQSCHGTQYPRSDSNRVKKLRRLLPESFRTRASYPSQKLSA
jgi:hypothetical protein